jgi:hypothetical protein
LLLFVLFGCYLCCSMYCLCANVYCHRVTTQLQLINISYIICVHDVQTDNHILFVISGLRRHVDEICTLLGCYAAYNCSSLPTFRDKISVLFSRSRNSRST